MSLVARVPHNVRGVDYVIGDIHGEFDRLDRLLGDAGFDPSVDRLFSVGDLVDRGPQSDRCLEWLARPWFFAVRGNHELMAIDFWASGRAWRDALFNGGIWLAGLTPSELSDVGNGFSALPAVIQIGDGVDAVGIVHADVPAGISWPDLVTALEVGDKNSAAIAYRCAWSRVRMQAARAWGIVSEVPGISRVYVGHTPVAEPLRLGNIVNVDTGAVFGGPMHLVRLLDASIAATSPGCLEDSVKRELMWD